MSGTIVPAFIITKQKDALKKTEVIVSHITSLPQLQVVHHGWQFLTLNRVEN
jgi:hypothetical protein